MKNVISEGDWKVETIQPQTTPTDNVVRILKPVIGITANNKIIAFCGDEFNEEGNANARLIAAAPDLLEACYELIFSTEIEKLNLAFNYQQQAAIRLMKAAIKKALL